LAVTDKHEIIAEIRRLASELGRPPSRTDYRENGRISERQVYAHFGSYTVAVRAAGLVPGRQSQKSIVKERIEKYMMADLSAIPVVAVPEAATVKEYKTALAIPDMHLPFWNARSIGKIYELVERLKPEVVIQLGDVFDFYSFTRFPRSHLLIRPDEELAMARGMAEEFWKTIRKATPKSRLIALTGNHDIRPHRRVLESTAPELEIFLDYKKWFEFDGVETIHDPREPFFLGDVAFHHGYKSGRGKHRKDLGKHVIHGHTHEIYLVQDHIQTEQWSKTLWEMGCGYVGDPTAKVFNFTPTAFRKWRQGCGYLHRFGPVAIDLE